MHSFIKMSILVLTLTAMPIAAANAGPMEGAAIGAGSGLLSPDRPARSSAASSVPWSVGLTSV